MKLRLASSIIQAERHVWKILRPGLLTVKCLLCQNGKILPINLFSSFLRQACAGAERVAKGSPRFALKDSVWILPAFPLFCPSSVPGPHPGCHTAFICPVSSGSSGSWRFLGLSVLFMILTVLRCAGHAFCRTPLCRHSSGVFS